MIVQLPMPLLTMARDTCKAFRSNSGNGNMTNQNLIFWSLPSTGRIKINSDGSRFPPLEYGSFGDLVRNEEGRWIEG